MVFQMNKDVRVLTPEMLVDLKNPDHVRLSPDGKTIVYAVAPNATGKQAISHLWIAQTGKWNSARQLTSGACQDRAPKWSPDGKSVAFLSDRGGPDTHAVYHLSLSGGDPDPITKKENKRSISTFSWSPSGTFIAYVSPDEESNSAKKKAEEKDDAQVYGENILFNHLRLVRVSNKETWTLYKKDTHVTELAWSEDSTRIVFMHTLTPDEDSAGYHGTRFSRIKIWSKEVQSICRFPGLAQNIIYSGADVFFIAGVTPEAASTSHAIYKLSIQSTDWKKCAFGEYNCADEIRTVGDNIAVKVQHGLADQIQILGETIVYSEKHEIVSWDMTFVDGTPVLAVIKSDAGHPPDIYSVQDGKVCQLSRHGAMIRQLDIGSSEPFYAVARDGTKLDGVFCTPSRPKKSAPYPTVVLVHGGPYSRTTVTFRSPIWQCGPFLQAAGYAIMYPNYRGGSSHGEDYAADASGGMGVHDYSDVITLVKEGVSRGLIDENRVIIGGWSQGGFLSYLSYTRDAFKFRGVICGAGVTDWDMMTMTSDVPFFQADFAGTEPWTSNARSIKARYGSPIWHLKDNKTPILILHGEQDVRVPLTQAIAFRRGCERLSIPFEMAVYPREGHQIAERNHRIDILKRVMKFVDVNLDMEAKEESAFEETKGRHIERTVGLPGTFSDLSVA